MITIKKNTETRRPVDISEWNTEVKAYVKALNVVEQICFSDQLGQYYDKDLTDEERAEAGVTICVLALVDEEGEPLLSLEQVPELKQAAFDPIGRVIKTLLGIQEESGGPAKNG